MSRLCFPITIVVICSLSVSQSIVSAMDMYTLCVDTIVTVHQEFENVNRDFKLSKTVLVIHRKPMQ